MKQARGFTLLEMMVATVIMAIAVVGLLNGISGATRNAARVRDADRIAELAQVKMNDLLVTEKLPRNVSLEGPFDPALAGGLTAGWRARETEFEKPKWAGAGQYVLDRVQLEVWWMSGKTRRTFNLEGYRKYILQPSDMPPPGAQ